MARPTQPDYWSIDTDALIDRAKRWTRMLEAAFQRGDYAGAVGYARHLEAMADVLRSRDPMPREMSVSQFLDLFAPGAS